MSKEGNCSYFNQSNNSFVLFPHPLLQQFPNNCSVHFDLEVPFSLSIYSNKPFQNFNMSKNMLYPVWSTNCPNLFAFSSLNSQSSGRGTSEGEKTEPCSVGEKGSSIPLRSLENNLCLQKRMIWKDFVFLHIPALIP